MLLFERSDNTDKSIKPQQFKSSFLLINPIPLISMPMAFMAALILGMDSPVVLAIFGYPDVGRQRLFPLSSLFRQPCRQPQMQLFQRLNIDTTVSPSSVSRYLASLWILTDQMVRQETTLPTRGEDLSF